MKKILLLLISFICFAKAQVIRDAVIDTDTITEIYVGHENPTTVTFPFPLQAKTVSTGSATNNPDKDRQSFYVNYLDNGCVMDLRAVVQGTTTFMNVINGKKVYPFKLIHVKDQFDLSLRLALSGSGAKGIINSYHPADLSAYMERTNVYEALEIAKSGLIEGSEKLILDKTLSFPNGVDFEAQKAIRWGDPHPDFLVMEGNLKNTTNEIIDYDRNSFEIIIGHKRFVCGIAQASGSIEPGESRPIRVGISGYDYPELKHIDLTNNDYTLSVSFTDEVHIGLLPPPLPDTELPIVTPTK